MSETFQPVVPVEDDLARAQRRRGLLFLGLAVGAVGFALAIQMGLNANFLKQTLGLEGPQVGVVEAYRESCGIFALVLLALLAGLAEPLVGAAMLLVLAVGLGAYYWVHDYYWLIVTSVIWSQGLHIWMPLPQSMTMALAEPGRTGRRMGQIQSANAAGMGIGLAAALGLMLLGVSIRPLYLLAGAMAVVAAAACFGIPRQIKTPGPRLVLRGKYWLYYLLCFLEGWRKQIFIAFAGFLLVEIHDTDPKTMLLLWIAIQIIGWVASPWVGRLIDRVGERKVLVFYFACLTFFFTGYAVFQAKAVLYSLFVIDSAFFVFAMALVTYVNRIAPAAERTPTLSMGVAFNHVSAVLMPAVGAAVWKYLGYQWVFVLGAVAAAGSIAAALAVPKHRPEPCPQGHTAL